LWSPKATIFANFSQQHRVRAGRPFFHFHPKISPAKTPVAYTFKMINGKRVKSASGLLEDYWFGHRIQHGNGDQVNVTIMEGYEIKAKKDIKIGEELFMDYNRSIVCGKCEAESDFYDLCFKKSKKCYFCGNMCMKLKKCSNCEACFICLQCYDKKQITF